MKLDNKTYELDDTSKCLKVFLVIGTLGLIASLAGWKIDSSQFYHSYLTAFVFWLSIGLGSLFFVMIHHLVDATWSVVIRRLVENVMATVPIMILFFIPVLIGAGSLYHWTGEPHDALIAHKKPFLNTAGFIVRSILYFAVWIALTVGLYKASLKQDIRHDGGFLKRMQTISGPGMLLFALSITFAAFDWLMSLDPHWYSTIFGVYYFAGSFLASLAFVTVITAVLRNYGILAKEITIEHFHDLGKLIFAFTVFWTYIAFSQYFLIWYGNIPEETVWYAHRWDGNWKFASLLLVFGHFVFPFVILLSRVPKRNVKILTAVSIWILVMHWIDMYWLVFPTFHKHHFHFSWMDVSTTLGIGGIFIYCFWKRLCAHPIIAKNDPKLQASMNFVNI